MLPATAEASSNEHPPEGGFDVPRGDLVAGGDVLEGVEAAPGRGSWPSEAGGLREGQARGGDGPSGGAGGVSREETVPLVLELEAMTAGPPCEVPRGREDLGLPILARGVDHAVGQSCDIRH